ncbi:HAMP domain-containing sensor histidine kinase, partial [Parabacteroides distasonis]
DERKIDKNQMRLHCKKCDISQFVGNVCSLYQYRADEKSIRLTFTASSTPARAWIDSIQFDKVINNLLSNAFKYTPDGGEIAVGVADNGKEVTVTVTDSGMGLDGENREKLFERFYQGKNSIKNQTPGTGIGLHLSRTIVEMHGGRITADNRSDGAAGAQFTVALQHGFQHLKPEYIDEDQTDDAPAANDRSTQTTQNTSVLVVDDNSDLTQYISNELGSTYRITTCADG